MEESCRAATGAGRRRIKIKPTLMDVLIFKTNLENIKHVRKLYPLLKTIQGILKWNIDLEDCDRILRVEVVSTSPRDIEEALQRSGFYCSELGD